MGKVLGEGQYGITREAKRRGGGEVFAVKTISKKKIVSAAERRETKREIDIMWFLKGHPNIVKIESAYEDANDLHIVMELCRGGELFDSIINRGHYTEEDAAAICRAMLSAVSHMHALGVMHRDLKPENFLLVHPEDHPESAKVTDFGLSLFVKPEEFLSELIGSAYYVAPEVLRSHYYSKADIWSIGVILYILLSGEPPFFGDSDDAIFQSILRGELDLASEPWREISAGAKECVQLMLVSNPRRRATTQQVLAHPWMAKGGASTRPLNNALVARISKFSNMDKFKRLACKTIAASLTPDEILGLKKMFE